MDIKRITSRNNPIIKEIALLKNKKYRDEKKLFFFEGHKLLSEAIEFSVPIVNVFVTESAYQKFDFKLHPSLINVVSEEVYQKISSEKSPEGILCVSKTLDKFHNIYIIYRREYFSSGSKIILDGIQDPGNLGTILRMASAFGCNDVILSSDCADVYNPKTVRASMGAVFRTNTTRVSDIKSSIGELQNAGFKVLAAALDKNSVSVNTIPIDDNVCFVIGNEGSGIRKENLDACDGTVIIPMEKTTESLNAANAATILLWEQYRSRK